MEEAEAPVRWYNERLAGLGNDFRVELLGAVDRIVRAPLRWPSSAYDRRAQRFLLPRFPYGVVYVVAADASVVVVAVACAAPAAVLDGAALSRSTGDVCWMS